MDSVRIPQPASLLSQCRKAISVTRSDITVSLLDAFTPAAAFGKIHDWMRHMLPFKLVIVAQFPTCFHSKMFKIFLKRTNAVNTIMQFWKRCHSIKIIHLKIDPILDFSGYGTGEKYEA